MAAVARPQRAPAGGRQGLGDAPRRTITAGLGARPGPGSDRAAGDAGLEAAGGAPRCRSRFLKVRSENAAGRQRWQLPGSGAQAASGQVAKSALGSTSQARSSSALRKVAQLESKILSRKKQMEWQNAEWGQKPLDEESLSSAASHEHSARGKKYLKSRAAAPGNPTPGNACSKEEKSCRSPEKNVTVQQQQLRVDSDDEEMRELMGSSLEVSSEARKVPVSDSKWGGKKRKTPVSPGIALPSDMAVSPTEVPKAPSFQSRDLQRSDLGGVNSLASRNASVRCCVRAQPLSASMKDDAETLPRSGNTGQSQISLESDRSAIRSLDELFSKAADGEDSASSSSDDFRVNILSLDDLAPDIQITPESNGHPKNDTFLGEKEQTSLQMTSVVPAVNDASEGGIEKTVTEAEISEHLSGDSAAFSRHKQDYPDHDETTVNSEYSEDFERSVSKTDRECGSKMSEERSEDCTYSGEHPSSASSPFRRERRDQGHRVTVRDTAVQTVDPLFTYCWAKTNASAVPDPPVGNSYVDPVPLASHVISMDAVEALTAYSPSVLVLNAMLRQHLVLTQQFVENVHHLHSSLVESLESERFHYHTLEETKEYIKSHKSPPLTIEQAREEVRKAQEKKMGLTLHFKSEIRAGTRNHSKLLRQ